MKIADAEKKSGNRFANLANDVASGQSNSLSPDESDVLSFSPPTSASKLFEMRTISFFNLIG